MCKTDEPSSKFNQNLYVAKDSIKGFSHKKVSPTNQDLEIGIPLVEESSKIFEVKYQHLLYHIR